MQAASRILLPMLAEELRGHQSRDEISDPRPDAVGLKTSPGGGTGAG